MPIKNITKLINRHRRFFVMEALLVLVAIGSFFALQIVNEPLYIAAVMPQKNQEYQNILTALNLYAERVNKYGGINGTPLKIQGFYDNGDPEEAQKIAQDISNDDRFLATIGHFNKETTQAAAGIYAKANMPLLAPDSSLDVKEVKEKFSSLFQITPTAESYGIYTAHYIKEVLGKKNITIAHGQEQGNIELVTSFANTFVELGGNIRQLIELNKPAKQKSNGNSEQMYTVFENIASTLEVSNDTMLLLATKQNHILSLIAAIKKQNINIPVMIMDPGAREAFEAYAQEKEKYPGYFSDGIYVPSVVLPDALPDELALVRKDYELNKKRTEKKRLSNRAIKAVKAVSLIRKALPGITEGGQEDINLRQKLQERLRKDGWFNALQQGKANNLFIGMFRRGYLVTAPVNPIIVEEGDVAFDSKKLLHIDEQHLYPADIVYAGISMNKISHIDMKTLSYNMDFFLWFRYREGVKGAADIEFLNALQPIKLSTALEETTWRKQEKIEAPEKTINASLVQSIAFNDQQYLRYHISGRFKTPNPKNYALGQQNLYVWFRNHTANRFRLSYTTDIANKNEWINSTNDAGSMSDADIEGLKFHLIDAPELTLNYAFSYISNSDRAMLGNPEGISESNNSSQFVAEYRVKPVLLSFRGIVALINKKISGREDQINLFLMTLLLSVSCALFLFSIYGGREGFFEEDTSHNLWVLQIFATFFILLLGELVVTQVLYILKYLEWGKFHRDTIEALTRWTVLAVEILWWLIPAYYITSAFEHFLWQPVRRKTGAEVPHVLRLSIITLSYTLAVLGIMAYVIKVTPKSLAATSGVAAILFALASKVDLSNITAGLGISFSKVFKLGDWVKIDGVEGKVIEMTHRSTKVRTFDSSVVNIPNSNVADAVVENFTRPDPVYRLIIHMETVPVYRFERVEKVLLDAVASVEGVLDSPSPFVLFKGQGDSCQIFEVAFFINDYAKRAVLWQATWRRIWRHLEQAGIQMATPQREIFLPSETENQLSSPLTILNNCGAFSHLSEDEKKFLAEKAQFQRYPAGEIILRPEEIPTALFIIVEGVVSLEQEGKGKKDNGQGKRLGVAEVFGINDLMDDITVSARTDTELMFINKEAFLVTQNIT
jgi:branched-chain amino acid transport system substrate-binding protein